MTISIRRAAGLVSLASVALLVSCSSDSTTSTTSPPTTAPSSTIGTTAAVATTGPASTVVGASTTAGSSADSGAGAETTTTVAPAPSYPLTGMPLTDPAVAARVAVVVKIDNHPQARPQSGLEHADIVFEEDVESLTRFAAVFQSDLPDPVGPIRSGRTQDVAMLGSLNKPIFTWSGGNPRVTQAINGSDFVVANVQIGAAQKASKAYRSKDRKAPHNLYAQGSGLETLAPEGAGPPPQQFTYLAPGAQVGGEAASGVKLAMDGVRVQWDYDAGSNTYLRSQDGKRHNAASGDQLAAANVIVLTVDYQPSPADGRSPEAQTLGSGAATVFTGGKMVSGTWNRADRLEPFALHDAGGAVIPLTPGRTWIELARTGVVTPLS